MQNLTKMINSDLSNTIKQLTDSHILDSVVVIIISFIIYKILSKLIFKKKQDRNKLGIKSHAYLHVVHTFLRYVFIIVTLLLVLQINNINVSSMLAGVGIASVIVGLAVQDALKDIIRGITIMSDGFFKVGDNIRYQELEGKVIFVGLRTSKIQNASNGSIVSVSNRNIEEIEIIGGEDYPSLPLPYELPLVQAEKIAEQIVDKLKDSKTLHSCSYLGVGDFDDCAINYRFSISYHPNQRFAAKREFQRACLETLNQHKINMPHRPVANITLADYKS